MLRSKPVLPQAVSRWLAQVAASLGATLLASVIYTSLPKAPMLPAADPALAQRTSGGKFAARVDAETAEAATFEQVGATPPKDPVPSLVAAHAAAVSLPVMEAAWGETGAAGGAPAKAAKPARVLRLPARSEVRRPADVGPGERPPSAAPAATLPAPAALSLSGGPVEGEGGGLLAPVTTTARMVLTFAAGTGRSLLQHIVP